MFIHNPQDLNLRFSLTGCVVRSVNAGQWAGITTAGGIAGYYLNGFYANKAPASGVGAAYVNRLGAPTVDVDVDNLVLDVS
jgi:hypothetical protein